MTPDPSITYHPFDPRVGPKCDACFTREPAFLHPIRVFSIRDFAGGNMVLGVHGGIVACVECSADLEAGESRLDALGKRAIEGMGSLAEVHRHRITPFLHRLHHGILLNKSGPRRDYTGPRGPQVG